MTTANTNVIAKVAAVVAGLGLVATSFASALPARAATVAELEAQIAALQAQLSGASTTSASSCTFTRDLTVGSQGADVTCLQTTLAAKGYFTVAPTGYFGTVTQAAVAKWQAAEGISPAAGYFGPISRAKFSSMGGGSTGGNTGGSTGGSLSGGEANLSQFDLRAGDSNGDENETEVEVALAEFDVEDGDVRVERVEVEFDASNGSLEDRPWQYFDTLYIYVDGEEVADVDASDRDEWDETTDDVYEIVFTGLDYVVDEDDTAMITIVADIASSIDTADQAQTFSVTINDEGIRAVDGEGIQQYIGDENDSISFGFGAEETGEIQLGESSEDPNGSILVADADEASDEYLVFVFEMENEEDADVLVTDITIDVATTTASGSDAADIRDIIRVATLMVDGEEYDGDVNANNTIDFDDVDFEIAGDETVEVELWIELAAQDGNYAETGEKMTFSLDAADVDAEGVDTGDTSTVDGDADGNQHSVSLAGIAVEAEADATTANAYPQDTVGNSYGTYTIKFDVTAVEEAAYIRNGAASTTIGASVGVVYDIVGDTWAGGTESAVITSSADVDGSYFVVDAGDTETFTLSVTLNPAASGTFALELEAIGFADSDTTADTTFTVDPDDQDFETETAYIPS